jgi:hypothetical protein
MGGSKPDVELRFNDDGSLDEVFAHGVNVHLEQLDDGHWYLGLSEPGDDGDLWQFWLYSRKRIEVNYEHSPALRSIKSRPGPAGG